MPQNQIQSLQAFGQKPLPSNIARADVANFASPASMSHMLAILGNASGLMLQSSIPLLFGTIPILGTPESVSSKGIQFNEPGTGYSGPFFDDDGSPKGDGNGNGGTNPEGERKPEVPGTGAAGETEIQNPPIWFGGCGLEPIEMEFTTTETFPVIFADEKLWKAQLDAAENFTIPIMRNYAVAYVRWKMAEEVRKRQKFVQDIICKHVNSPQKMMEFVCKMMYCTSGKCRSTVHSKCEFIEMSTDEFWKDVKNAPNPVRHPGIEDHWIRGWARAKVKLTIDCKCV